MLKIFTNLSPITKNKFDTKTSVIHIPNDKSHIITCKQKITWLGLTTVKSCSCKNCIINKENKL